VCVEWHKCGDVCDTSLCHSVCVLHALCAFTIFFRACVYVCEAVLKGLMPMCREIVMNLVHCQHVDEEKVQTGCQWCCPVVDRCMEGQLQFTVKLCVRGGAV